MDLTFANPTGPPQRARGRGGGRKEGGEREERVERERERERKGDGEPALKTPSDLQTKAASDPTIKAERHGFVQSVSCAPPSRKYLHKNETCSRPASRQPPVPPPLQICPRLQPRPRPPAVLPCLRINTTGDGSAQGRTGLAQSNLL